VALQNAFCIVGVASKAIIFTSSVFAKSYDHEEPESHIQGKPVVKDR